MPFFLGERYIPAANQSVAVEQAKRVREAVESAAIASLRLVSTTFVPNEEWVFDLFEAESVDHVKQAYAEGNVPVERVTEAVHLRS